MIKTLGTVAYRLLLLVLLAELTSHVALGARALALMALSQPKQRKSAGPEIQNAGTVVDGGDEEKAKRFSAGDLQLPDGTKVIILEDSATRTVVYITPQGAAAAHIPSCESSDEDEELEDTGIRMARKEIR